MRFDKNELADLLYLDIVKENDLTIEPRFLSSKMTDGFAFESEESNFMPELFACKDGVIYPIGYSNYIVITVNTNPFITEDYFINRSPGILFKITNSNTIKVLNYEVNSNTGAISYTDDGSSGTIYFMYLPGYINHDIDELSVNVEELDAPIFFEIKLRQTS